MKTQKHSEAETDRDGEVLATAKLHHDWEATAFGFVNGYGFDKCYRNVVVTLASPDSLLALQVWREGHTSHGALWLCWLSPCCGANFVGSLDGNLDCSACGAKHPDEDWAIIDKFEAPGTLADIQKKILATTDPILATLIMANLVRWMEPLLQAYIVEPEERG